MICASCGHQAESAFKFCPECGAPSAEEAPREERKVVTVLFCDLTGSTALGERLDPEPLRALLAQYFERMRSIVDGHGGTVEKFIGDAVMAVFGVPVLHEDDALRAVRAAAEMRAAFAELGVEGRIGVSTGEVVTGTVERLVTGDPVNVAARLEQAAPPGEVLLGRETLQLVRDAVEVEELEPLALKGKRRPVPAFRLVAVREAPERDLATPMIGRDRQARLLAGTWETVVSDGSAHLFTVLGPAGVGKSRLVADFVERLPAEARVVRGRCPAYGDGITYWPVVEILVQLLGDDRAAGLARLGIDDAAPVRALLGEREVLDASADEIAWAVRRVLEAAAESGPLVVVFDDVHWGAPTFLDLVEHVADWSRGAPILLLCMARPDLLDRRPGWAGGKVNATTLLLEPLAEEDSALLIDGLLGADADPQVRGRVLAAAEGNPLFVEEMVALLRSSTDRDVPVPPSIQALLAARLDQLQSAERAVLQRASVEGKVFHRGAVTALAPEEPDVRTRLMELVRKELIRPDRSQFPGDDGFRFRHLLIRDVAYDALPKSVRAELHERFAVWLEEHGERLVELPEILGHHLEQACRYRRELGSADAHTHELARRAGELLGDAAEAAAARLDGPAAAQLAERAVALLPEEHPRRNRLRLVFGEAVAEVDIGRGTRILAALAADAAAAGDTAVEWRSRLALAWWQLLSGETTGEEALAVATGAVQALTGSGDDGGLAYAWRTISQARNTDASVVEVGEANRRTLEHARRAGDARLVTEATLWILLAAAYDGETTAAEARAMCEAVLDGQSTPTQRAAATMWLGVVESFEGRYEDARRDVERGRSLYAELNPSSSGALAMPHASVLRYAGDLDGAERILLDGDRLLERVGDKGYRSTLLADLADLRCRAGRVDEAWRAVEASEALTQPDDVLALAQLDWVRARLLARGGRPEEAVELAEAAVARLGPARSWFRAEAELALAEALRAAGRDEDARGAAGHALAFFEWKGVVPLVEEARSLLAATG